MPLHTAPSWRAKAPILFVDTDIMCSECRLPRSGDKYNRRIVVRFLACVSVLIKPTFITSGSSTCLKGFFPHPLRSVYITGGCFSDIVLIGNKGTIPLLCSAWSFVITHSFPQQVNLMLISRLCARQQENKDDSSLAGERGLNTHTTWLRLSTQGAVGGEKWLALGFRMSWLTGYLLHRG